MLWSRAARNMAAMIPKNVIMRRSMPWCSSSASSAAWPVPSRSWRAASSCSESSSFVRVSAIGPPPIAGRHFLDGTQQLGAQVSELQHFFFAQDSHELAQQGLVEAPAANRGGLADGGDPDDGGAPVRGIRDPLDQAGRLQVVDQAGDVAWGHRQEPRDRVHLRSADAEVLDTHQRLVLAVADAEVLELLFESVLQPLGGHHHGPGRFGSEQLLALQSSVAGDGFAEGRVV